MLKNYIKIAIRIITRQKLFSFINVFGLSLGIASSILILSFVFHELNYDRFHEKADRIVRINATATIDGEERKAAVSPNIVGPLLAERVLEVENYVRFYNMCFRTDAKIKVRTEDFTEKNVYLADSSLADIFDLNLVYGSESKLLTGPNDLLLSEKIAAKYFGSDQAVGQTLQINGKDFIIRGVYEDFPTNSHIYPEIIGSLSSLEMARDLIWHNASYFTFLLLNEMESLNEVEEKLNAYAQSEIPDFLKAINFSLYLEPLTDIHLYSEADMGFEKTGDIKYIYAFLAVAIFIIIIACFNYMNLSSARSMERSRETGMRKVLGAKRSQLFLQYMGESFILTMISLLLAVGIVELVKPYYLMLIEQSLEINIITNWRIWIYLLIAGVIISVLAGLYPAVILSSFKPTSTLKGKTSRLDKGSNFRKGLVILQFSISTFMIIGTLVVYKQLMFMQNTELGFHKEQVMILTVTDDDLQNKFDAFKSRIINHSSVHEATSASSFPGRLPSGTVARTEGMQEGEQTSIWVTRADEGFVKTMGVEIIQGRDLLPEDANSEDRRVLINETAANMFGWTAEESIGKKVNIDEEDGVCVGVMKDFNFTSLRDKIEPLAIYHGNRKYNSFFIIKLGSGDIGNAIAFLDNEWKAFTTDQPFDYFFLDVDFNRLYKSERKAGQILLVFAAFTIIIACLGLFGLSSYVAIQRTKEIGIRKVMGSTTNGVMLLMIKDNLKFIFISFLISVPIGFIIMKNWLLDFAFRINVGLDIPLISILTVTIIALITVSFYALKAALTNPVDSLRYE
ncbi:ABC transporter permease [Bacteroidota bacterium]